MLFGRILMVLGISGQGGTFQFTSQAVVVTFFMKINRLLIYILRRTFESVAIKLQYIYNAPAEFVCVLMDKATFHRHTKLGWKLGWGNS